MRRFRTRWPLVGQICLVIAVGVGVLVVAGPTPGAFPGANGKIAFVSDRSGPLVTNDVWIMNADGSDQVNLTNVAPGAGAFTTSESFSADGARIVFNGNVAVPYDGPHLYVMDSDGSNMSQLTSGWPQYAQPGWSPDGTKIVFYGTPSGSIDFSDIYTMNADGSNPVRLTESGAESSPKWSPDGGRIMFESWRDGNGEIYVMNADGTNEVNLTNNPAYDWPGSWSPDGSKIVFMTDRDGNQEIYTMNADGTHPTRLTSDGASDHYPAWSPDGTKIAFSSDRTGDWETYVMNADGSGQTNLTNSPGSQDVGPSWQPLPDTTPPTITCSVSPNVLWPPNNKLVPVSATVSAVDPPSGPVLFELVSVATNQGDPAADIRGFVTGAPDTEGSLRATRLGSGGDRTYTLTYKASDPAGNSAACKTTVTVPHDNGR